MEVHHHNHEPATHHEMKNWKTYVWEFLMLFFAVFCGFLAEYQLEHTIEHDREMLYMKSLLEDLQKDTLEINTQLKFIDNEVIPVLKKSSDLLYSEDFSDSTIRKMYEVVPKSGRFFTVSFEDRTESQLKNSGNLRLIRKKEVTDGLAAYWKTRDGLKDPILTAFAETRGITKELVFSLFNSNYFVGKAPFAPLVKNKKLKLLSYEKVEFLKLANHVANLETQMSGPIKNRLNLTYQKAVNLIKIIKERYDLN